MVMKVMLVRATSEQFGQQSVLQTLDETLFHLEYFFDWFCQTPALVTPRRSVAIFAVVSSLLIVMVVVVVMVNMRVAWMRRSITSSSCSQRHRSFVASFSFSKYGFHLQKMYASIVLSETAIYSPPS